MTKKYWYYRKIRTAPFLAYPTVNTICKLFLLFCFSSVFSELLVSLLLVFKTFFFLMLQHSLYVHAVSCVSSFELCPMLLETNPGLVSGLFGLFFHHLQLLEVVTTNGNCSLYVSYFIVKVQALLYVQDFDILWLKAIPTKSYLLTKMVKCGVSQT